MKTPFSEFCRAHPKIDQEMLLTYWCAASIGEFIRLTRPEKKSEVIAALAELWNLTLDHATSVYEHEGDKP